MWGGAVLVFSVGKIVVTCWLVNSGDFRFISGYVCSLLIAISVVNGLAALKPPHELSVVLPVYPFPVGILLPVWISFPVRRSYLDLPALVTGLPWQRPVMCQGGSRRVSDRLPGALRRNPTRRTDRWDLRYGLDQSPYLLPAISSNYLPT